jgi:hypothetical protein
MRAVRQKQQISFPAPRMINSVLYRVDPLLGNGHETTPVAEAAVYCVTQPVSGQQLG